MFFRIFSPARFSDQVTMRWYWKLASGRWERQDSIPIDIVGGREQGFRGYGFKSNYQPGAWKVEVETTDGREIGRVYFVVESVPEGPRRASHGPILPARARTGMPIWRRRCVPTRCRSSRSSWRM